MKKDFLKYQAQTTDTPLAIEVSHAKGSYLYDTKNKKYLDFIAGVSANTLGHSNPIITNAIKKQVDKYLHVMVYGEFIQKQPVALAKLLIDNLPTNLNQLYFVNSGTEATEGALKLAKKVTKRSEIIAAKNGYHGNTQGAMSVCGVEEQNRAFRPLLPNIKFIEFNNLNNLVQITSKTACVILETIQGGAGFIVPKENYLKKVSDRCKEVGALLILDEIQSGIGRTGKLFEFMNHNMSPDILITGKGLGGGLPIGAFIASTAMMSKLKENPKLGHITTFGGNSLITTSALATLTEVLKSNLMLKVLEKEKLFRKLLVHSEIKEIRGKGLMLALIFETPEIVNQIILKSLKKGLLLFWLLFEKKALRITPPLTISDNEIKEGCTILLKILDTTN
ncbi:MAG: aspartate aminotransferase family protein [Flavobacteriaceae bacterium]|nr:aspartate aminotransferase family protein [Flavobacteriaceae bacterium]